MYRDGENKVVGIGIITALMLATALIFIYVNMMTMHVDVKTEVDMPTPISSPVHSKDGIELINSSAEMAAEKWEFNQ